MIVEGKTKITLLVQNSHKVFCYFNYSPLSIKEFEDRYGEGSWNNSKSGIKLCSLKGGISKEIKTIEIDNSINNWYIDLDRDDEDLFLKLGKFLGNGEYITIALSNVVTTPRAYVSTDTTINYIDIANVGAGELRKLSIEEVAASNGYDSRKVDAASRESYFNQYYDLIREQYSDISVSSPIR